MIMNAAGRTVSIVFTVVFAVFSALRGPADAAWKFKDLDHFPQTGSAYLPDDPEAPIADYVNQVVYAEEYLRRHFLPWNSEDLSFLDLTYEKLTKYYSSLAGKEYYTPAGKIYPKKSLADIAKNGTFDPAVSPRPGVVLAHSSIRALAYENPLYRSKDTALGANGYLKLDVLQASAVRPGEPVAIYNASADSNWLFVVSGTALGWVKAASVALVKDDFINLYTSAEKSVLVKDNVKIKDSALKTEYLLKLGTVLPSEDGALLLPIRGKDGFADIVRLTPEQGAAEEFPVRFTPKNAARAIDEMMGERYGWGSESGLRDCSAMTRDYFSIFGIWLPRTSSEQSKMGSRLVLKDMTPPLRENAIKRFGAPFASLIHMPGHIMLYIGLYGDEPAVFHNTWGVVTGKGRAVVGRAVASGLRLGEEIPGKPKNTLLLDRIDVLSFPMTELIPDEAVGSGDL